MGKERRRDIDGDDSLLASVAGVPLTRLARVVEVLIIGWTALKRGVRMLIAKTTPSLKRQIIEELIKDMSLEEIEAVLERKREKELRKKESKGNRKAD